MFLIFSNQFVLNSCHRALRWFFKWNLFKLPLLQMTNGKIISLLVWCYFNFHAALVVVRILSSHGHDLGKTSWHLSVVKNGGVIHANAQFTDTQAHYFKDDTFKLCISLFRNAHISNMETINPCAYVSPIGKRHFHFLSRYHKYIF